MEKPLEKENRASHRWVEELKENDPVRGDYLVKFKRMGTTRRGDPYLSMILADRTGEVEARVWDGAEDAGGSFAEGDIVAVEGRAGSYRNQVQLILNRVERSDSAADPSVFLESTQYDVGEMMAALKELLGTLNDPYPRVVGRFLSDAGFVSKFKRAPAAKSFHHAYLGGLLEHTLSVCRLAAAVSDHYPHLDRDLLLCGGFLHDIGKVKELTYNTHIDYSDEGRLVGHLVLGSAMLDEKLSGIKGFPESVALRLRHLVLSHHGEFDFGSPKRPKFPEAFALHLVDDLDAKMNGLSRFMARDSREGSWTEFNRLFERYLLKGPIRDSDRAALHPDPAEEVEDNRQGSLFST
jgi:3'-5' exoribonuclease